MDWLMGRFSGKPEDPIFNGKTYGARLSFHRFVLFPCLKPHLICSMGLYLIGTFIDIPLNQSIYCLSSEASLAQIAQKELLARQRSLVSVQQTLERLATAGYRQRLVRLVRGVGGYPKITLIWPLHSRIIWGLWNL